MLLPQSAIFKVCFILEKMIIIIFSFQVLDEIIINNPTTVTTDSGDIQFILNSDLDAAEELIQAEEVADQGGPKGVKVELEYNLDGIMGSDLPNVANYGQPQYNNVQVQIIEQPAPNKLRFR